MVEHQLSLEGQDIEPWKDVCSPQCWIAQEERCTCKCGGVHHGQGIGRKRDENLDEKKPDLKIGEKQMENKHPDAVPPTLVWWECCVPKNCPTCGKPMTKLKHYDHDAGWPVLGFTRKQWLYRECHNKRCADGKVGFQWAAWKLGVSRDEGEPQ